MGHPLLTIIAVLTQFWVASVDTVWCSTITTQQNSESDLYPFKQITAWEPPAARGKEGPAQTPGLGTQGFCPPSQDPPPALFWPSVAWTCRISSLPPIPVQPSEDSKTFRAPSPQDQPVQSALIFPSGDSRRLTHAVRCIFPLFYKKMVAF